ncbi:MAG: hypothetical protein KA105_03845 [Caulobacter sp.]|nr:hypothetical protein [Caulobacter sp.]
MAEFILLMHDDIAQGASESDWAPYLAMLGERDVLRGGSAIGDGAAFRRDGADANVTAHLTGFIRIEARDLDEARGLLVGNPVYEAGGTVEVRALPRTD